jgi:hypothetical protein
VVHWLQACFSGFLFEYQRNGKMTKLIQSLARTGVAVASITLTGGLCQAQRRGPDRAWTFIADKYDRDNDGRVSSDEYDRGAETFGRLDRNHDGFLSESDWKEAGGRRGRGGRRGDGPAAVAPKPGERAPDFDLPYVKKLDKTERLSSFAGKKPVALVFGSYT